MSSDRGIEINFCTETDIFMVIGLAVPRVGEAISIMKIDYEVVDVYWALDYAAMDLRDRRLRATVSIRPATGSEK